MCSIIGIHGNFTEDNIIEMLKILKHRGPDGFGIYDDQVYYNTSEFSKKTDFAMAHNLLSIVGECELQPICSGNLVIVANAELYNYKDLIHKFNITDLHTHSDCEVILKVIESNYNGNLYDAVVDSVGFFDGDYAFTIYDGKDYITLRDMCGVKPIYYGKNSEFFAFASEQKALKHIGINDIENLNPRCMLMNDKIIKFRDEYLHKPEDIDYEIAVDNLTDTLIKSVQKRVENLNSVAVLFSGGVDSTILVKILLDLKKSVDLYTIGVENSQDLKVARKVADEFNLPLHTWIINEEIIEEQLLFTINTIESTNLMKIGVGMTIKLTSYLASKDDYKVILSGQGADELFAGYNRYKRKYETPELLYEELTDDLNNIYNTNLERDDKATMSNGVELRVPYLDKDVINIALKMPYNYLLKSSDDNIRKHILRDVALKIGVPPEIALRPKKAAQYATGIDKIIRKKLLKKEEIQKLLK